MKEKFVAAPRRLVAEALGTAFLLAGVVGSGIMAARLAGGNGALALLCNTLPTGAILTVLILTFGPVSGAHFNPAVSIAFALRGDISWRDATAYIAVQIAGGIVGVWMAHAMFELPLWQVSLTVRTGPGQWFAELVATFGLLLTILGCLARTPAAIPYAVGLYITAAYWFTASTSFANPAVTSRGRCPIPMRASLRPASPPSSPRKSPAPCSPPRWRAGCLRLSVTLSLTKVTNSDTKIANLARRGAHSGCDPDCGAGCGACARSRKPHTPVQLQARPQ